MKLEILHMSDQFTNALKNIRKEGRAEIGSQLREEDYGVQANKKSHNEALSDEFMSNKTRNFFVGFSKFVLSNEGQWCRHDLLGYFICDREQSKAMYEDMAGAV